MIRSMDGAKVVSAVSNFEIYGRNLVLTIGVAHENNLSDICTNHNNIQSPEPGREWKIREVR